MSASTPFSHSAEAASAAIPPRHATATPSPDPPADTTPPAHRLTDTPLRTKLSLLITAGLVLGLGLAFAQQQLDFGPVPLLLALITTSTALVGFAQWWAASPVEQLAARLDLLARTRQPIQVRDLPVHRRDETGRIARAMHNAITAAIRCDLDQRQLRRTLDQRVQQQTAIACAGLERLANRDPLTDLANRRCLHEHLPQLFAAAKAANEDLIAIAFDLDRFKDVNDKLGHAVGDEHLVLFAGLLRAHTRYEDLPVRLGGDEFLVLLPGATPDRAHQVAQRIAQLFRQQTRAAYPGGPHADVSFGIASLHHHHAADAPDLLAHADRLLYQAKSPRR